VSISDDGREPNDRRATAAARRAETAARSRGDSATGSDWPGVDGLSGRFRSGSGMSGSRAAAGCHCGSTCRGKARPIIARSTAMARFCPVALANPLSIRLRPSLIDGRTNGDLGLRSVVNPVLLEAGERLGKRARVLHIAIIGSGPAGYYTAEAAQKQWGDHVRVDIFDCLPVPYGLIRTGVAPDHQSIKAVSRRYEGVALSNNVRFVGNVLIGKDVSVAELQELYDAVVLATGAPHDRKLGLPGEDLENVFGSAAFVGWYNGHPQFSGLDPDLSGKTAVVIGNGNVALDVARILAKTRDEFAGSDIVGHALERLDQSKLERIVLLGRRGPHQIAMTPKELGELGHLERASPRVSPEDFPDETEDALLEPGQRKSVTHLRSFAAIPEAERATKRVALEFDFFAAPKAILGSDAGGGKVDAVEVERTRLDGGRAVGTGETYRVPADLVVACIGYQTSPITGVPFDESAGRFANEEGRILPGLYCVGWARRGPSGTIGTNRPDGYAVIEKIAADIGAGSGKQGREGFDALAEERDLQIVTFRDWKKIDEAEARRARDGAPREKFVSVEEMIAAVGKD
jgi:adrenodoxin-NADP+ reductase